MATILKAIGKNEEVLQSLNKYFNSDASTIKFWNSK